jgi:Mg2+-importing ATPase
MIVFGLLSTVFDLLTFAVLLYGFEAGEAIFQTAWFVVSLLTELAVVLVLRTQLRAYRSMPSRLLLLTTIGVAVLAFAIPYAAPVAAAFDFVPLPGYLQAALVLIVAAYLLSTEVAKRRFFADTSPPPTRHD